jgi:hypothetical protein
MDELNNNGKVARDVPGDMLFTNAQKNFADIMTTPNVNNNIFHFIAQYWSATTYPQESRYDLGNRNIPQNWWTIIYRDVLQDLTRGMRLIRQENPLLEAAKIAQRNRLAIAQIERVHAFSVLLNTFGNIPYTQALNIDSTTTPAYDDQKTVYYALLDSLTTAIGQLDDSGESFGKADLVYGGDVASWYTFGNSLLLRLAMNIADENTPKAKGLVETAAPHVFTSNEENAAFPYLSTPPNANPIWVNLVQSNRNDFVAANTLVNPMNTLNDPRRKYYFTEDPNGNYSGGIYGSGNTFGNFSHVSETITEPNFPGALMNYAEVEFLLAEAVERGFNVGGTAAGHYAAGIRASIEYWGGTVPEANTYLAQPSVAYATATGTWKQKIGTQEWIALFLRGFDAWTVWRRLDYPQLPKPASAITDIPVRYTYPSNEQNLNQTNYEFASTAIGGDKVTTKLFWDKF